MADAEAYLIRGGVLHLETLQELCRKPVPVAPGERAFWDDAHISQQLLAEHLNRETDAASRQPEVIERTVRWLLRYLDLRDGDRVLDLGCGPGLYCAHFSRAGLAVTGIDYSRCSIAYARGQAVARRSPIHYLFGDYLAVPFPNELSAIFLIYGDFCVLADEPRDALLRKVHTALRAGGHFVWCRWVRGRSEAQRRAVGLLSSTGHSFTPPATRW
jgi:SAM-dependent methyltransferase